MEVPLSQIIQQIPADTKDRVEKTKSKWNSTIRDTLRRETGLRLNRPETEGEQATKQPVWEAVGIPIRLIEGLPAALEKVTLDDTSWLAIVLGKGRSALEMLRKSSAEVQLLTAQLAKRDSGAAVLRGREAHLKSAQELADALLKELGRADPLAKILSIEQDVLGIYHFELPQQGAILVEDRPLNIRIELYWSVIGLVAQFIGKSPEALSVVVLAHELAHAYTHLGADIDGHRWASAGFRKSELPLVEGLAQYYTDLVCRRIKEDFPEAHEAYGELLARQPKPYWTHVPWTNESQPEEIRSAMIEIRRQGTAGIKLFESARAAARKRLRQM